MDDEMIVRSAGYNGTSVYSLSTKEGKPIFTNKTMPEISSNIVRQFPALSKKISQYEQNFTGDFSKELDLSMLDPTPRAELIKTIARLCPV